MRPASARALSDAGLVPLVAKVHADNYGVYGVRKVWHQLRREGHDDVARCTVERLMRINGLRGVSKVKSPRTTVPGKDVFPEDQVNRAFTASAPDQLWVADITYVKTHSGWVYAAFILDMFSRRVVGWQVSTSLHTRLALDALDMALWARRRQAADLSALIHHSDRGVQYRAIRYTERLADAGVVASVGSKGDSYDNAAAEAFNSLYKSELIRNRGPWAGVTDVEIATASTSTGSTTAACTARSGTSPRSSTRTTTTLQTRPAQPSSPQPGVSTKPGAMHFLSRGARPACLTTARALVNRVRSPVSARIAAAPTGGSPSMEQASS